MNQDPSSICRFNGICRAICLLWLFVALPMTFVIRPTYQDFSLYYMAGVCARTGSWDALYPRVPANSTELDCDPALLKPELYELAREWDVDLSMPYIQPPWNALFFAPLTLLPYRVAHGVWIAILLLSTYGMARYAGATYELSRGSISRMSGLAMLLVALSALAYRTVRVGNVSAVVGFTIAFATFELMRRDGLRGGIAIWVGGLLKFATVVFFPLLILARRWRTLACVVAIGVLTIVVSYAILGPEPFREYAIVAREINKSIRYPGNQSLHGYLLRSLHRSPIPASAMLLKQALQAIVGLALLWLIIRRARSLRSDPPMLFAAVVGLTAWLLIFAPFFWDHYHIYFTPLWGWLLWEASESLLRRITVTLAIVLAWVPLPAALWFNWPEPFGSYMLWSGCLMLGLAIARLWEGPVTPQTQTNSSPSRADDSVPHSAAIPLP